MKKMLAVFNDDERISDAPTFAEVEFNASLVKKIRRYSRAVKELGAYNISDFDLTPDFKADGVDGKSESWDGSIDALLIKVSKDDVHWAGYIKDTNILIETATINLKELYENWKVFKSKNLPLMIGHLRFGSSNKILEEKLKGE